MRTVAFWEQVLSELDAGRFVYLCFVVEHRKGSPGTTAARMILTEGGEQFGTIGGGIMEKKTLEAAGQMLAKREPVAPVLQHFAHRPGTAEAASGLICGGAQSNVYWVASPDADREQVAAVVQAARREAAACVSIDETGLRLEPVEAASFGAVSLTQDAGHWRARLPLAIFGGGHCGAALAGLMVRLDYAVTVIEPREGLFTLTNIPEPATVIHSTFEAASSQISFPRQTIAVVMTYSMPSDIEALEGALRAGFKEIGLMGSPAKTGGIRKALVDKGFPPPEVDAIRAPLGLRFNSDTPDEIAVSVAAQILLEREQM